ncbi:MAG: hypothetical protein ACHREM_17950 [Polyangiales bacterium]
MQIDEAGLAFFNALSGRLRVELSEEPKAVSPRLANLVAAESARVVGVSLSMTVYERESFRALTEAEWRRVVIRAPRIRVCNGRAQDVVVDFAAPDGTTISVRDLTSAIEMTEAKSREASRWFGGVDVHHVFFEGISLQDDGAWATRWGS